MTNITMNKLTLIAYSDLKKYAKLNGYKATTNNVPSFKKHLSMKFNISEFEINRACAKNKIRLFAEFNYVEKIKVGDTVKILPNRGTNVVEKIEDGFIWVNGRPYMPYQLELI